MKYVLILSLALLGSIAQARCEEDVDRAYDLSERLVLTNKAESFLFERCVLNKCEKITGELPRDITLEQFREFMGPEMPKLDDVGGPNTQFISDALGNFRASPENYRVLTFGYSKTPETYDVWCHTPKVAKFLESVRTAKEKSQFVFKYEGKCNDFCQASGDSNRAPTSMSELVRGVKNLEKVYTQARKKILAERM